MESRNCTNRKWYPWFICAMCYMVQFVGMSFHGSFGPLYVKMLRHFNQGDAKTAWIASISFAISLSISPITYRMDEKIGQRNSMIIGSSLFGSALLISSFATNLNVLFFTIGVLLAVGLSFCQAASMFVLPHYFGKNYVLALGIALSGGSIGSLVFSNVKGYIFVEFSYRTGMQILAATSIILFLCGLTFKHPENSQAAKQRSGEDEFGFDERYPPLSRNKSFYMLLVASFIYHIMHLLGYVHLTRLAGDLGVSDAKAALLPGILALSESAGKISSGRFISYYRNRCIHLYQAAWTGMAVSSFFCPFAKGFSGLCLYAVAWGFCVGNANGACVPVINELVGSKMVVRAYSIFLMCLSPAALAGPPVAGWLRETTLSYDTAFYTAGATIGVAAALLSIVRLLHHVQRKEYKVNEIVIVDENETAEYADSEEPDLMYNETLYIMENDKKCKLIGLIENSKAKSHTFSNDCKEGKITDKEVFHIEINEKNGQKHLDYGRETSI